MPGLGSLFPNLTLQKAPPVAGGWARPYLAPGLIPWALCGGRRGVYWTMGIILMVLWVMGLITGSTEGSWVHLLLVFSLIAFVLGVASLGRRRGLA
jgi:hypothetical protein